MRMKQIVTTLTNVYEDTYTYYINKYIFNINLQIFDIHVLYQA